jgi:hypothetical protein
MAIAIPLVAATLIGSAILYQRDYPATLIEAGFLFQLIVYLAARLIWSQRLPILGSPVLIYGLSGLSIITIRCWAASTILPIAASAGPNTRDQAVLAAIQREISGGRLWIIVDNTIRPLSIDTAIMKGGSMLDWLDPDSPILRSIYPNVDYRFKAPAVLPIDLSQYEAVLFPYTGPIDDAVSTLARLYSTSLLHWQCEHVANISTQPIGICRRRK